MSLVSDLEKLLAEEQKHLLSGNFTALERLIERKSKLAERLAASKPDLPRDVIEGLARRAAHNEALLGSARRGLQAAMAQLRQLPDGEAQKTYSKEGQRQSLARKSASVIQKL